MAVRPKIKPPLLASAKIPDTKIRKIIEGYAYCVPAADTAQAVDVSYLTARTIYGLIRRRMIELGFYLTPSQYEAMKEEDEGESYWDPAPYRAFVRQHVGRRRGVTPSTLEEHSAELIFWYEKPPHQTERQFARQHHVDVLQLLKLTAPFNRPLTAAADQAAYLYRAKRTLRWGEERLSLILQSPEIEKTIDRVELRASFHFRQKRRFGR